VSFSKETTVAFVGVRARDHSWRALRVTSANHVLRHDKLQTKSYKHKLFFLIIILLEKYHIERNNTSVHVL